MRILLTGKNGQLGWELHRQLERDFRIFAIGREDIDFRDTQRFASMLRWAPKFDLIVNTAAYTDVDRAEREPFVAETVNSEAAAILAAEADRRGIPMIHFSTSHVFNGRRGMYRENDPTNPVAVYGRTKLEGEHRIRNIAEKHLIVRLSGLYGTRCKNFFTDVLARNRSGVISRVVDDQTISPNWTPMIAEAVADVIGQWSWGEKIPWGTYHLSGSGSTTPYKFARLICEKINGIWGGGMPLPVPITSRECRGAAKRPKFSVLDSTQFNSTFQIILPNWQEQFLCFFGGLVPR